VRPPALLLLLVVMSCASGERLVRWEDVDSTSPPPAVAEAEVAAPAEEEPPPATPPPPPPPEAPAELPVPVTSSGAPVVVDGKRVDDGDVIDMPALELACLADARALTDPARAAARFEEVARRDNVNVGTLRFVRLVRDPARSIVDPPPRLCRALLGPAALKAPLEREREPASRWIVVQLKTTLGDDAARLARIAAERKLSPTATPRVLLDEEGRAVGVALPGGAG
jgi:hypothetical protein